MDIERRLSRHFDSTAGALPDPAPNLDTVVRRGRRRQAIVTGASAIAVVAAAAVVTLGVLQRQTTNVEFDPAVQPAPASEAEPTEVRTVPPSNEPTEPGTAPAETTAAVPLVAPENLDAPVLVYKAGRNGQLVRISGDQREVLWPDPVIAAFPDGEGGVVLQPRSGNAVIWLPAGGEPATLVVAEGLYLRGLLADGRVIYSTRTQPRDPEQAIDIFYAVDRAPNPEIERLAEEGAHESSFLGPVPLGQGRLLSGGCHLMCTLWEGFGDDNNAGQPVYDGQRSIDGVTATPDGSVVAFWESHVITDRFEPQLVLLDGENFRELARIDLPVEGPVNGGTPVVSLANGGNKVLVAAGGSTNAPVPGITHLIRGALSEKPRVERVDADGVVRWLAAD